MITFDLECTDKDKDTARVTQLAFLDAAGAPLLVSFVNPDRPIKKEAAEKSRITDDMVKDAPAFRDLARRVADICDGATLVGFGAIHFDIPVLARELELAGLEFSPRCVIDAGNLFKRQHSRTLGDAVRVYLDEGTPDDLHRADADAEYTRRVYLAQRESWSELKDFSDEQIAELSNYGKRMADPAGHLAFMGGKLCLTHRRVRDDHRTPDGDLPDGVPVGDAVGYANWMLDRQFPAATKRLIKAELDRLNAEARAAEPAGLFG